VCLAPSLTDIAVALGKADLIAGVTRYDDAPEVKDRPRVGGFLDPSPEAVVALRPDLVLWMTDGGAYAAVKRIASLGVPVRRVLLTVYTGCAALAGLGGVVMASQLRSGAPTYGQMYELYVIAAVVVGGTSLSGGKGQILGTLIGAFIIQLVRYTLLANGVPDAAALVVKAAIIILAVWVQARR
jgi:predicted ABC-type sugar transport system permease subunit